MSALIIAAPALLAAAFAIIAFIRDFRAGNSLEGWRPDWLLLLVGGVLSAYCYWRYLR